MVALRSPARFPTSAAPLGAHWGWARPAVSIQPAAAFAICVAIGAGNDILFHLVRGTYAIYVIDYALKALMLLVAWRASETLAPVPARRDPWPLEQEMLVLCFVVGVGGSALGATLGPSCRLFEWPAIASPTLRAADLSLGLLLSAGAEELAYRRLALAVLPFSPRANVVVGALIFGFVHWGAGPGSVIAATLCGLAFGYAYRRTGSLFVPILAHYLVNLALFA